MGTRIAGLPVVRVVDGDTLVVALEGRNESLRLVGLDTEESHQSTGKPVTEAGLQATAMAKAYFADAAGVDLEFDTDDPPEVALVRHRDNYGRLLVYVHKDGENYNLKAVREGFSPYFVKYGRSRLYHDAFLAAEAAAQAEERVIWNPRTNAGGPARDYTALVPWWALRDSVIEDYRRLGPPHGVLSVRLDHPALVSAAERGEAVTVFCDLQSGISRRTQSGAVVFAGSPQHPFNLWIPDVEAAGAASLARLITTRYAGIGRGYVYVTGAASLFRDQPQLVLRDITQLADRPPQ